jgi:hypothetical protein
LHRTHRRDGLPLRCLLSAVAVAIVTNDSEPFDVAWASTTREKKRRDAIDKFRQKQELQAVLEKVVARKRASLIPPRRARRPAFYAPPFSRSQAASSSKMILPIDLSSSGDGSRQSVPQKKRGPKPTVMPRVVDQMRREIAEGVLTEHELEAMLEKEWKSRYGGLRAMYAERRAMSYCQTIMLDNRIWIRKARLKPLVHKYRQTTNSDILLSC